MPVAVYHATPPDFMACQPAGTKYVHVADVDTDDLEVAYEKTNSIDAPWWLNQGVAKTFPGKGARSTSMGDLAFHNGVFYRCESVGWEPYTPQGHLMTRSWIWPLSSTPLFPDEPGRFGSERVEDVHTGVDLYCELGTEVRSVEDGEVVAIEWFTGQHVPTADGVPSTWWNDTKIILIRGASGVVGYGECSPLEGSVVGARVRVGQRIAVVDTAVLKSFKGRPMVMLHLELYRNLEVQPDGTNTMWWKLGERQPENLIDPTSYLERSVSGNTPSFKLESYTGQDFRDYSAPSKAAKWWGVWGGDFANPPSAREVLDASIAVIFNERGDVLLLQRRDEDREFPGGYWGFPGGKRDPGETPREAAEREVLEETGLVVKCSDVISTRRSVSPRGRHFNISIFFAGPVSSKPGHTFPTKEHQDYGWKSYDIPVSFLAGEVTRWVLEYLIGWAIRDGEPAMRVSED